LNGGSASKKRKREDGKADLPNVIKLVVAPDNNNIVAVTDDKYIKVLTIDEKGGISELSQRSGYEIFWV